MRSYCQCTIEVTTVLWYTIHEKKIIRRRDYTGNTMRGSR